MKRLWKKITSLLLSVAMLASLFGNSIKVEAKTEASLEDYKEVLDYTKDMEGYSTYLLSYDTTVRPNKTVEVPATDYVRVEGMEPKVLSNYEGIEGDSLFTEESGLIEYEFEIEETGFYELGLDYFPIEGKSASIQRSFFIDGTLPYSQLSLIQFSRIWENSIHEWIVDNQGNDLKPTQVEKPEWVTSNFYDSDGYVTDALSVYLTKGTHTMTIISLREPMVIHKITFSNHGELKAYKDILADYEASGYTDSSNRLIEIQAENADIKSSQMLYPTQDQSSPAVFPYSAKELKNNTIGGNSWRIVGDWIEWSFQVPESGYYNITLHARQNFVQGTYVSRKIYLDGIVPFEELSDYAFKYKSSWEMKTLQNTDGEDYKFYLEKGTHTIRLEAVLGEFSDIVNDVQNILTDLNAQYRKIIRITGVAPDEYRDYQIEKTLPNLGIELVDIRDRLDDVITRLRNVAGSSSNKEAALITMRDQLTLIMKDTEKVTKLVKDFKVNISALGTWITQVIEQPLQLDAIYISSPNQKLPKIHNSFWDNLIHELKKLFWSFFIDYNTIGNVANKQEETQTITVWVGTGRDQANVIKSLVDEKFTSKTNINVNIMLVDMNTLLQATLSGQGPDVAMQVANGATGAAAATGTTSNSNDLPMNYGLRSAVVDLSTLVTEKEIREVASRFRESALEPYTYEDSLYALPETQTFPMMFYRKDILKELGLETPTTWDEMKVVMSVLNENQMELGMLPLELIWTSLLYQNGGELYVGDGTASALDSDNAVNAFKVYTEFYTDYKLDKETSVEQRFRTGEAPIIIADYTTYNNFQVSAPDIKGLWGFAGVPGTIQEEGTINNTVASTGLACMMMNNAKDKDAAWQFMKWWTSAEIQTSYGREMEGLMGAAARYPSANIEAFDSLPWPVVDYEALAKQYQNVKGIPQVPGGYYSWRNVNNAFYRVVSSEEAEKMPPREALTEYMRYINEEITYKRAEFGLNTAK